MRHRKKRSRQHYPKFTRNTPDDEAGPPQKRSVIGSPRNVLDPEGQQPPSSGNTVLRALYDSTNSSQRQHAITELSMSSGSETDSFHNAFIANALNHSLHTYQGTSSSPPSTQSPVTPSTVTPSKCNGKAKAKATSDFSASDQPGERRAPALSLFPDEYDMRSLSTQKAVPPYPSHRTVPLPPFLVVESHMRDKIMRSQKGRCSVPWGTQFYLVSLASFGLVTLNELEPTSGINALRSGSNVSSLAALFDPKNQPILWHARTAETPVMSRRVTDRELQMCAELDRETQMLKESPVNGVIGPQGMESKSFGGRVLFEGRISCLNLENPPSKSAEARKHREFSVQLLPPKLGGSCRFSRRFGSQSILRLKMDSAMAKDARRFAAHPKIREIHQEILHFFTRRLQILDRVFRPFICKDETIFYLWIDSPDDSQNQPEFDCVWDFIDHHAPFAENADAPLGKFIQRIQLGLSTSVPTSIVERIDYIPDVLGDPHPVTGKREVMTDGAGSMSLAVAHDIASRLGYASVPSAFQGRLAGSKGVWYLDPTAQHCLPGSKPVCSVAIRDSQKKICYPDNKPLDLSQHVADLLGPSRTFAPSTLSKQIILVLHSNGVPVATFAELQAAELCAIHDDIVNWNGPDTQVRLHLATVVERLCKVETLKAKRSTEAAEHCAQGMDPLAGKSSAGEHDFGDDDRSIFFGPDERHLWNGMPLNKHERAYDMLLHGFHPKSCPLLADLLIEIASQAMKRVIGRFAIPIRRSAEAMVIPDPTGTLEEGEIQFRFSGGSIFDPDTKLSVEHVPEGEVLVTRHPCLLPTDIRKVKAVVRRELSFYQDVVVFSTKGQTPLASLLSGGDYDGDLVRVFWEPALVEPFRNADVRYAKSPFKTEDVFNHSKETVKEFVGAQQGKDKEARDSALIERLVAGIFDPAVRGLYGVMHLYAAWQFGIQSAEAVELAHKFCQCMDAAKTGLVLKPQVRIADSKKYLADLPEWAYDEQEEGAQYDWSLMKDYHLVPTAIKNASRPESVLCALWNKGKSEVGQLKKQMQDTAAKLRGAEDRAISDLWRNAVKHSRIKADEAAAIQSHCQIMEKTYVRTNARTRQTIENKSREMRSGKPSARLDAKSTVRLSRGVPLRRVQSEATAALGERGQNVGGSGHAVDDLDGADRHERRGDSIEVPTILGSTSEVAMRFCQWPRSIAAQMAKMDKMEVLRLEALRASYAYSITYSSRPKFAFEMAWRWIMYLKAESSGSGGSSGGKSGLVQGGGSLTLPISTLDVLGLRKRIISRNFESTHGSKA